MVRDPFRIEVGRRLRATASAVSITTTAELANFLGAERGQVDAWINGRALPPVPFMRRLCDVFGLTLDWIYLGKLGGLSYDRAILLQAISDDTQPPTLASPPSLVQAGEPAAEVDQSAPVQVPRRRKAVAKAKQAT